MFDSLEASEQEALRADVLRKLHHARQTSSGTVPEWEELRITMRAYAGITSVRLTTGGGIPRHENGGEDQRTEINVNIV